MKRKYLILSFIFLFSLISIYLIHRTLVNLLKETILNEGKNIFQTEISIEKININYFNSTIHIKNLSIKDIKTSKNINLILVKNIYIYYFFESLFKKKIVFSEVFIDDLALNVQVFLINNLINTNVEELKNINKKIPNQNNSKSEKTTVDNEKKKFLIQRLIIQSTSINIKADLLSISKDLKLEKITLNNIGNSDGDNSLISSFGVFFDQVLLKINSELNKSDIKKEIRNKLSKIKDNISNESLKKLERIFR